MEIAANYAYTLTANPLSRKCLVLPVMLAVGQEFWISGVFSGWFCHESATKK
jgi:hypothetical protein